LICQEKLSGKADKRCQGLPDKEVTRSGDRKRETDPPFRNSGLRNDRNAYEPATITNWLFTDLTPATFDATCAAFSR
jgi:hypothetical protein